MSEVKRVVAVLALGAGRTDRRTQHGSALPANAPKVGIGVHTGFGVGPRTRSSRRQPGYIDTPDGNQRVHVELRQRRCARQRTISRVPGPVLCATQGETVVVNLTTTFRGGLRRVPRPTGRDRHGGAAGLLTDGGGRDIGHGQLQLHRWSAGTYLYESGFRSGKHGRDGASTVPLIVRPSAGRTRLRPSTQFDPGREYLMLLSEIDPDLHHGRRDGRHVRRERLAQPVLRDQRAGVSRTPSRTNGSSLLPQPAVRLARPHPTELAPPTPAGADPHDSRGRLLNQPFHTHGNHTSEIAQDGRLLLSPAERPASTEHFGETIAPPDPGLPAAVGRTRTTGIRRRTRCRCRPELS